LLLPDRLFNLVELKSSTSTVLHSLLANRLFNLVELKSSTSTVLHLLLANRLHLHRLLRSTWVTKKQWMKASIIFTRN
jgi:hypothetical protein